VWLSRIGSWGVVWLALAFLLAVGRRSTRPFVLVVLADAAAYGVSAALKAAVGERRPRGYDPLVALPHSSSFPSGHATMSFACATVLAVLEPRAAPAFLALAAAIAYSRLYLGVHWPLDVLAGAALGVAIALLLLATARRRSGGSLRSG
jgi:membrane-associated phospholipid phosphatase